MAVNPSPLGPKPQFELAAGTPAVGYKLFFYVAGSVNTKQNTYTDSTGVTANTNPIVLNSLGQPTTQIWFTAGQSYKIVYAPDTDTDPPTSPVWTIDNLVGINDASVAPATEWIAGPAPTYVSATSFTLVGDQTSTFTVGRRLKFTVTAGTVYGRITVSAFAALTTVTVVNEPSQALDSGLSAVSYGILSSTHQSIPWLSAAADTVSTIVSAATLNLDANAKDYAFVSGTTGVTAITLAQGKECTVEFQGALTMTNGASLILPGAGNITTAAGAVAMFRGEAAGVVRCVFYSSNAALVNIQKITVTGTYTPTAGMRFCWARIAGGGGGSGGCAATAPANASASPGGASGGTAEGVFTAAQIGASQAATIGAGGIAGTAGATTGGTGGTTSLGALLSATGGAGSTGCGARGDVFVVPGPTPGIGSGGTVNLTGITGHPGFACGTAATAIGGAGGPSPLFGGSTADNSTTLQQAGIAGVSFGSGATGAANGASQGAAVGAAGSPGVIVILEFC